MLGEQGGVMAVQPEHPTDASVPFIKVKSNLLTLTEHHNSDIGSLLESLANDKTKLTLVQAKLSSVLTTVEEYRSENALVR